MRFAISGALLASQWLVGWWIGARLHRLPAATSVGSADVAVVIPARNEGHAIGSLVAALRAQSLPPVEIVVVDDGSSDDTAARALEAGAEVVLGAELPPDWNGKAWACQQGADATQASTLVFVDADVTPSPTFLERLVGPVGDDALVSVQPRHIAHGVVEGTAAACNLIAVLGAGLTGVRPPAARVAFGPCLALSRKTYAHLGGHAAVRAAVPEDLALAQRAIRSGVALRTFAGGSDLRFRMYPEGFGAMVRGFTRNLAAGMGAISPMRLIAVIWWVIGLGSALGLTIEGLARGNAPTVLVGVSALLAFTLQWVVLLRAAGSFGLVNTLVYPVPLLVFLIVVVRSLWARISGVPVTWRGRPVRVGIEEPTS